MADLDHKKASSSVHGHVEQDDDDPELVKSVTLVTGRQYEFAFLVSSRDNSVADPHTDAMYGAQLLVGVSWDADPGSWAISQTLVGAHGGLSVAWAAAMNGNALEITADYAAEALHMATLLGFVSCEFATSSSGA